MPLTINDPLALPCGVVLPNRLVKSALSEGLADPQNRATEELAALYRAWSAGGTGLLVTGNIQVDRRFLERPGNVAVDDNGGFDLLSKVAQAATSAGSHGWVQIGHPGRQAGIGSAQYVAPSQVKQYHGEGFARELSGDEVKDVIRRFVHVATVCRDAGFGGAQVHAAHGYLISQFLNPLINKRTDEWGGLLENRARLLLEIVRNIRAAVGPKFPVSVKLNSADFQKGGMTEEESMQVILWLEEAGIDLLEISGGSYESMKMVGRSEDGKRVRSKRDSTIAREAYFLEFAAKVRPLTKLPLMVTGGFRNLEAMNGALARGELDLIGLGRPLCLDADLSRKLLNKEISTLPSPCEDAYIDPERFGDSDEKALRRAEEWAANGLYFNGIRRIAAGENVPDPIDWLNELNEHLGFDQKVGAHYQASWS